MKNLKIQIEEYVKGIEKEEYKTLFLEILKMNNGDFKESKRLYENFVIKNNLTYLLGPFGKIARIINKSLYFKTKREEFMGTGTYIVLAPLTMVGLVILNLIGII